MGSEEFLTKFIIHLLKRIRVDKLEEYAIISAIAACDGAILQAYVFPRKTEVSFGVNRSNQGLIEPGPEARRPSRLRWLRHSRKVLGTFLLIW